jgi:lipopolysaccharide export system protein LptA
MTRADAAGNMKRTGFIFFALLVATVAFSQVPAGTQQDPPKLDSINKADSLKVVEILSANRYGFKRIDSLTELLVMVGKVALKQENTTFFADSAVYNRNAKVVEAFGNVHINDNDSIHTYSDYLLYHTTTKIAILKNKVRLTDGKSNLYTEELEYDVNNKIGIYRNGGRVVNGTSVLTSGEGTYYADIKDVYFRDDVKLRDPKYDLETDSLLYNTTSEIATFVTDTKIVDSAKRTILTKEGFYDLQNKYASFGMRPIITDGPMTIIANQVDTDDNTGVSILTGNAIFKDTAQGVSVLANSIVSNRNAGTMVATQKPVMIIKQESDSTFISADTLYSGRLSELRVPAESLEIDTTSLSNDSARTEPAATPSRPISNDARQSVAGNADTSAKNMNDSTDRYFAAYFNVKIFSDSLQAVCDSLFYSGKDSIFRLFRDPIVWSGSNQVTGDTIYMYTKNKQPHELYVFENGLMVNRTGDNMYNQVRGNRIFGYFTEGEINYIRSKGNAESIYYAKDSEEKIIGVNKATSDIIDMRFKDKELNRVVFISAVNGTMLPFRQATEQDRLLRNFKWHQERRPKSKFELFGN